MSLRHFQVNNSYCGFTSNISKYMKYKLSLENNSLQMYLGFWLAEYSANN